MAELPKRTPLEVALVMSDGTAQIVDLGAPATLIWLSDAYPDADPAQLGGTLVGYQIQARAVHHIVARDQDFTEWADGVEMVDGSDETVEEVRAYLAEANGSPTPAAAEEARATAATRTRG